ncbi:MAG: hypothetical protein JJE25_11780 [Bacteroidia bacterium]|nr:hypothetical protein [Bacteroidia bacterium]
MKKKLLLFVTFYSFACSWLFGQGNYGNEWINATQDYFKIKIVSEGIYRIDSTFLRNSGVPLSLLQTKHQRIQIFRNGIEQYLYIFDANSNDTLNQNDFIEFYADKNDGSFDKQLYADTSWQPNPRYSLFNDTAIYFLTWNNSPVGKRVTEICCDTNSTSFNSHPNAPFFTREVYIQNTQEYNLGPVDLYDVDYGEGEGWVDNRLQYNPSGPVVSVIKTASTRNIFPGPNPPDATFKTVVCGRNANQKHLKIINNFSNTGLVDDPSFMSNSINEYNSVIPPNQLGPTTTDFRYQLDPSASVSSVSFAYLQLQYPHTFNFQNEGVAPYKMFLPDDNQPNNQGKSELAITNFNFIGYHIFYDLTNHRRIAGLQNGNQLSIYVPNSGREKICYLTDSAHVVRNPAITAVSNMNNTVRKFTNMLSSTVALDDAYVIISNSTLWSAALQYKAYRSGLGGNHNVYLADIDELYDQFAYGIRKHPLAIKNFARFMMDKWTSPPLNKIKPSYIFIIGKGHQPDLSRNDLIKYKDNLVPTFGVPGSDILFTSGSGFVNSIYDPVIPIGRLAARNSSHVLDYKQKVQFYEAKQALPLPEPWMKEVIHFGGGADQNEQNTIRGYLSTYKDTVEGYKYGGHVNSYFKTSSDPIQSNQSDTLRQRINNGVSLITFFGHAAATGFDISTDNPSTFSNSQKYPLVVANSCFAGNLFTDNSVSEDFVLQNDKGAIGFIASINLGFVSYLARYTTNLYSAFSDTLYGETIGRCMQYAILNTQVANFSGEKRVCLEMILHGDPAIRMNSWSKAELSITQPDIYFTPADVTTLLDSFKVNVIIHNLARAVSSTDSFFVNIRRVFPDGSDTIYSIKKFGCFFRDTVTVNIPMSSSRSAGLNRFDVLVDSLSRNDVPELYDEVNNNKASTTLFIKSSDIYPVYPYKYAIVPYSTVTLKASTADPFAPEKRYVFQIDTSDAFNSANPLFHKQTFITSKGGVVSWPDNLALLQDSTVYYWRVALDLALTDTNYRWNESSFIYIPAKTGWSQAHFFQFKNDKYENIVYNKPQRRFDYVTDNKTLFCQTGGQWFIPSFFTVNNIQIEQGTCNNIGCKIQVAVFDSLTFDAWTNDSCLRYFGQFNYTKTSLCATPYSNCAGAPQPLRYFQFELSDTTQIDSLISMLNNKIPSGNFVLAYTFSSYPYSLLGPTRFMNLKTAFQNLGSALLINLQDTVPFIFFTKVGDVSSVVETVGISSNSTISISAIATVNWNNGKIISEIVGPSRKWTSLHWKQHPLETPTTMGDSVLLQVFGIDNNGAETLIIQQVTTSAYDTTLGFIPTSAFPYLKLVAVTQDTALKTPPQLDRWQVYYDEAPEAAINPNRFFEFHASPLSEGDTLTMRVAIENISQVPMDSMSVDFYLYDNNRNRINLKSSKEDSLRVGQYVITDLKFPSTFGLAGNNNLWVEANPYNLWHQAEQYHYNNFAQLNLKVNRDVTNPILDVTFDAVHIIDGDIVSGKPHILIRLHDENKFLALNDTNSFTFFLKTPSRASAPVYFFNSSTQNFNLRFTPAVLPKNSCKIDWDPTFNEDGKYELIVQGRDISLNQSGIFQYKITFEVINRSTITNVMNYPNPFSTSTRFVFTLTGSVVPNDFKIQIMTVTGKVVREIMRDELGNVHIGRNITDYAWNGKDEYGDQLANGLYLYRVLTKINGENIEKRETEADNFFKNGFGKMYLMR